jgi:8-oxo-dGTP pyrophosphatase MutT (NUDIX family)
MVPAARADAATLRARLRAALEPAPAPEPAPGDRLAAVLVPIVEEPTPAIVFTRRSEELRRHAGEISFPGGIVDPGESLAEAALREAQEEIGLDPELPVLIGALSPVHTAVSAILVVPFVGMLAELPALTPQEAEIAEILAFPIARLARAESLVEWDIGGRRWKGWTYEMDGGTVWGATGAMLHELLEIVRTEAPWLIG